MMQGEAKREILSAASLSVGYGGAAILSQIDLSSKTGEILTLIGPNGAGKSTILKTLIRELRPLAGVICLNGEDMAGMDGQRIARSLSAVLTARPRTELMSCEDVVATGRFPYTGALGILSAKDWQIVQESMELVRVSDLASRDFRRISDGQRQRVLLARAICQEPEILILDEPTSFLDIRHKLDFLFLLRELLRKKRLSVILTLHELELAQRFSDRILCIRDGRIDRAGTPEEIFQGKYIDELYGIEHGSYDTLSGGIETQAVQGSPLCFVLGGGGSGIPVYRALQRLSVPFAAGILPESDLDWPVAKRLASALFSTPPFSCVSPEDVDLAMDTLRRCRYMICVTPHFGAANAENRRLLDYASAQGMLLSVEKIREVLEREVYR